MIKSYTDAMRNYATFSGRMSRSAYWQFVLVYIGIGIAGFIVDNIVGTASTEGGLFIGVVSIVHLIPSIASLARRLHDTDKSALWLLITITGIGGLLIIIFACLKGISGPNRYGDEPLDAEASAGPARTGIAATSRNVAQQPGHTDVVAELERLATLRSNGSLSESEYEVMKSRLLARDA